MPMFPLAASGVLTLTSVKSAAYTTVNGDWVPCDSNAASGDFAVQLPASPSTGHAVRVTLVTDHATRTVTIDRNGSNINGGTAVANLRLVLEGDTVDFVYVGGDCGWRAVRQFTLHESIVERAAAQSIASGMVVIRNDTDPAFSTVGNWSVATGQGYLNQVTFIAAGSGANKATWAFTDLTPGVYRVSATWFPHTNRATNSPYTVKSGGVVLGSKQCNQKNTPATFTEGGTAWEDIGGPYNVTGNELSVELTDLANGYVIADAIRIERTGVKIQVDTSTKNVGGLNDVTTNYRVNIRRDGKYYVLAEGAVNSPNNEARAWMYVNGSITRSSGVRLTSGVTTLNATNVQCVVTTIDLVAGDYVELYLQHTNAASQNTTTESWRRPKLTVSEKY